MTSIRELKCDELPKGVKRFWLIRQDYGSNLILELYENKGESDWHSEIVHVFEGYTTLDQTLVLKETKKIIRAKVKSKDPLYIEKETFWDED